MHKKEKVYECSFTNTEYIQNSEQREIYLEYYLLFNEEKNIFGIEVLKKEINSQGLENIETEFVTEYNEDINVAKKVIGILGENRVTPVTLNEVLLEI